MLDQVGLKKLFSVQNFILLHFAIFSIGLFRATWTLSRVLSRKSQVNVADIINHMCDWIAYFPHDKLDQLIFFVFSLVALFVFYGLAFLVMISINKRDSLWIESRGLGFWSAYFSCILLINIVFLIFPKFFLLPWLLVFGLLPAIWCGPCIKKNILNANDRFRLGPVGCLLAICVIFIIFTGIFSPLILKPLNIANEFMDIPEKTILQDGKIVDNNSFANEHNIGGILHFDPRKEKQALTVDTVSINVPMRSSLVIFLRNPKNHLFFYNEDTQTLFVKGKISTKNHHDLLNVYKGDRENELKIDQLLLKSRQMEHFYKTRVYTQEEKDFIQKNVIEDFFKIRAGWFFFHHSWVLNPILALSLGASAQNQVYLYGWGSTIFIKKVLSLLGGVSFQNYFKTIFIFYPIYFLLFLIALYTLFKRADFVCIGAVVFSASVLMSGYIVLLLAPGYNPVRHLFDMLIILLFFLYLKKTRPFFLLASLLLAYVGILWSKDFGLFLLLAMTITGILQSITMEKFSWGRILFWIACAIMGFILYAGPYHGVNYNLNYMLLGYTVPRTSYSKILITLWLLSLCYLLYLKYRKINSPYYWLSLFLFFYVQFQLIYFIWNPSPHHLLVATPTFVVLILTWCVLLGQESHAERKKVHGIGLISCLILFSIYFVVLLTFNSGRAQYERVFSDHIAYNWLFKYGKFQTTMEPQFFADTIRLVDHYETHPSMYMISKYDSILPVLVHRYNALPVVNLALDLASYVDVARCVQTIENDKPEYIFVDTDIGRDHSADIIQDVSQPIQNLQESTGRALAHVNMQRFFLLIKNNYESVEKGQLLTAYRRKSID